MSGIFVIRLSTVGRAAEERAEAEARARAHAQARIAAVVELESPEGKLGPIISILSELEYLGHRALLRPQEVVRYDRARDIRRVRTVSRAIAPLMAVIHALAPFVLNWRGRV